MSDQYLRKYQVIVSDKTGQALDVSDLRCTFHIEKRAMQATNYADIEIFNLTGPTEKAIIKEGHRVIVNAGYQDGAFNKIFEGDVFQALWDRENVTDYKLTLHCIDGDSFQHQNFMNFCLASGYDYRTVISNIASKARVPITMGEVSTNLSTKKAPRGKVLFGDPKGAFRSLSSGEAAHVYVNDGKLEVMKLIDIPKGEALVITPQTGLVGTPQQCDEGFSFRCLLNPNVQLKNPPMMVKIDNAEIKQQKAEIGQQMSMLDQEMVGQVIQVTHHGDTRGNNWYTDAICVSRGGKIPAMMANATVNSR